VRVGGLNFRVVDVLRPRIALAAELINPDRGSVLVFAPWVGETVAQAWRARGVQYADTAGNVWLRKNGLVVDVRGRARPPAVAGSVPVEAPGRWFKPAGLKTLLALLANPGLIGCPQREIAVAAGVSLGAVHRLLADVVAEGWVSSLGSRRQLRRPAAMFEAWVEAYRRELAPKLSLGIFAAPDPAWFRQVSDDDLLASGGLWGGETAAELLGAGLRAVSGVVYAPVLPTQLLVAHRLTRASAPGAAAIRRRFWAFDCEGPCAPVVLVYADLLAAGEPRLAEAAVALREAHVDLRRFDGD
jgi:hypothetical protein